ncbi:response regulator [Massilia sp. W12]|uniref:response regulator n=1 Tax=Massilia sp. W12 TaxID=3126507 RepID=UPI0030D49645
MINSQVKAPVILFVDDEEQTVKYFQRAVGAFAQVVTAGSVTEGKRLLDEHAATLSVLISDQRMPGGYGNELLHYARDRYPNMVRILTTAYSELDQTIEAVNQGQIDRYMQKPWDITVLRLELKLALELASLRKGHTSLLQEKLEVLQKQLMSNRIGSLQSICINVAGGQYLAALDAYLHAALAVEAKSPGVNWSKTDYFELVGAEALRNGFFGRSLQEMLARQRWDAAQAEQKLLEILGPAVRLDGSRLRFVQERLLAEYLEGGAQAPVSAAHISWLAALLWLDAQGCRLNIIRNSDGLFAEVLRNQEPAPEIRLANWIERF